MSRGAVSAACTWLTPRVVGSKPYLQRGKGKANETYLIWSYLSIFNHFLPNLSYSELFLALLICPFSSVYSYPSLSLSLALSLSRLSGSSVTDWRRANRPAPQKQCVLSIYLLLSIIMFYSYLLIVIHSWVFLSIPICSYFIQSNLSILSNQFASINLLINESQSINRWMNEWMNQSINQPINQWINESMNQYFYQSIYLSIGLSIQFTLL